MIPLPNKPSVEEWGRIHVWNQKKVEVMIILLSCTKHLLSISHIQMWSYLVMPWLVRRHEIKESAFGCQVWKWEKRKAQVWRPPKAGLCGPVDWWDLNAQGAESQAVWTFLSQVSLQNRLFTKREGRGEVVTCFSFRYEDSRRPRHVSKQLVLSSLICLCKTKLRLNK